MKINSKTIFFLLSSVFVTKVYSYPAFTTYSDAELNQVQSLMLQNIASDSHAFKKKVASREIVSIPGAVMASPSLPGPGFSQDYQFHWSRDAAITMHQVLKTYVHANEREKKKLYPYLMSYIQFEARAQKQTSKPGEETLGQPKFNLDTSVWEGKWGRPQNDGPGLRAVTTLAIANQLLLEGKADLVRKKLLPVLETDLNYIKKHWKDKSYGLWEEVLDQDHYFNKIGQYRALKAAVEFYKKLGLKAKVEECQMLFDQLKHSLNQHWNASMGYFSETIHHQYYKGGGLNASILLGSLFDDASDPEFSYLDDRIMSTAAYLRGMFAALYPININTPAAAPLLGRYPSDIYDGDEFKYGNPWVLISHAMAEYYYRLAVHYQQSKQIVITERNQRLFAQLGLRFKPQTLSSAKNQDEFKQVIDALVLEGDRYLTRVKQFATCESDGICLHFAEQIDRASGKAVSAKDLTWGYETLLSAVSVRRALKESSEERGKKHVV